MNDRPILSVCLITYNHEKYIAQAVESVLQQKVNFTWEFIIADDHSIDGTRMILSDFGERNPDLIKLILQDKNVGPSRNWHDLIGAAKGKYIAYFEGDDYWTDSYKLMKQIDFLETHPEFVGCFHNAEERFEEANKASFLYCGFPEARKVSFAHLAYGNLIPSCSMVYRNKLFAEFPAWFYTLKMGDWPLHLLNAQFGDYWYMPHVMGVHRLHSQSTWMMQDDDRNNRLVMDAFNAMINGFENDKVLKDYLIKGKEHFVNSLQKKVSKPSYKEKIKHLMGRVIQKL